MKLRITIVAVTVIVAAGCAAVYFYLKQNPVAVVVDAVLKDRSLNDANIELTPELETFVNWYEPMVSDAPREVVDIMRRFDAKYRSNGAYRHKELEEFYPTDEWIKRLLDMGIKIESDDAYWDHLETRWFVYHAANDPEELQELKDEYGLDASASFEDVIDAEIRHNVLLKQSVDQAMAADPWVYGGELGADGVFIPYRHKTVYLLPGDITAGSGVPKWVVYELRDRELGNPPSREIPKDIEVVYLNREGQPRETPPSVGDAGEIPTFHRDKADAGVESASSESMPPDRFDDSYPDEIPTQQEPRTPERVPPIDFPTSVADLEKQLASGGIEAELSEELSPERFDKVQQLIDQYGSEEGLRRFREMDPEAARRFEREQRKPSVPSESGEESSTR